MQVVIHRQIYIGTATNIQHQLVNSVHAIAQ